ncbi:MAG TPA: hypothetical protein VFF06_18880 [Polyangia bacterium]|nr:hypothetical protein [Polyangia bacterium]
MAELQVSAAIREVALPFKQQPGVRGVFYGQRLGADGKWTNQLGLSLHVLEAPRRPIVLTSDELPRGLSTLLQSAKGLARQVLLTGDDRLRNLNFTELIDLTSRNNQTPAALVPDVIVTGATVAHTIDNRAFTEAGDREASVAAFAWDDGNQLWYGLMSGHGVLPIEGGQIARSYRGGSGGRVLAQYQGQSIAGTVLRGDLGNDTPYDWALASFRDASCDGYHSLACVRTPEIPLRTTPAQTEERVKVYSAERAPSQSNPHPYAGNVRQIAASPVTFNLPDNTTTDYDKLLVVSPADGAAAFSVDGDSGSLVVDDNLRALGMIVGGSELSGLSYLAQLRLLAQANPNDMRRFFSF